MGIDRIQQRLGEETSKVSVNTDSFIKINLDGEERLLPSDEMNRIVDVGKQFNFERQSGKFYRILGTINPTVSNVLFNINGSDSWSTFNENRFRDTDYPLNFSVTDTTDLTYKTAIKTYLKEIDGWFGYFDPDKTKAALCIYYDMEPKRERFSFIPDTLPYGCVVGGGCQPVKNWELTITYPASADTTHFLVDNGLFIFDNLPVIVSTRNMAAFGVPVLHNLNIGDTVRLTGMTPSSYNGDYPVVRTGLDNGDLKGYYFVVDIPSSAITVTSQSRMKRVFGGQESEYYFRMFKKIKTRNTNPIEVDDYEVYKLAFGQSVFNDDIIQFVFNEDIDITDLKDNLGRPLSELYLTKIKTNSNGLFSKIKSGLEMPQMSELNISNNPSYSYLRNIPVIHKIHNGTILPFPTHTPLESNVTITGSDVFYGDVVEYNKFEVKENILGEVSHRFNTLNREGSGTSGLGVGPRQEGYYYKAHDLIRIRDFSSYVEQGDIHTIDMPDYREDLGDGRFLWRDMLEIGFNDARDRVLDYPFVNGCHYMYQNYCFDVKRQDPFSFWELYFSGPIPADPIGQVATNKFTFNLADNVC